MASSSSADKCLIRSLRKTYEGVKDSEGRTVLHFAASGGKTHVCKYLIEHLKLDVNLKDGLGQIPLCHAILGQHLPTTTYLIERGGNLTLADNKGYTALHCTAEKGRLLLLAGLKSWI